MLWNIRNSSDYLFKLVLLLFAVVVFLLFPFSISYVRQKIPHSPPLYVIESKLNLIIYPERFRYPRFQRSSPGFLQYSIVAHRFGDTFQEENSQSKGKSATMNLVDD
jgi:hypothetical protein